MNLPVLYSFRRCPYAMRARLAIWNAERQMELREVVLRDKPPSLLAYSPKATVPVLVLPDGQVIDESFDVMLWALGQRDSDAWLKPDRGDLEAMRALIRVNDEDFKTHLDRYKYPHRYEGADAVVHRTEAERFLATLEERLREQGQLFGARPSLADYAIVPFIRQFANTDRQWFDATKYTALQTWLAGHLASSLFLSMMSKYPQWHEGDTPLLVP